MKEAFEGSCFWWGFDRSLVLASMGARAEDLVKSEETLFVCTLKSMLNTNQVVNYRVLKA